ANANASFPQQPVHSLLLDHSSRLWVGAEKGLYLAEPGALPAFHQACATRKITSVATIFEDFERSIWIGTGSGVYRMTGSADDCQPASNTGTAPVLSFTEDAEG